MSAKTHTIRKLTRKDRKVLTSLIKKLADKSKDTSLLSVIQTSYNTASKKEDISEEDAANASKAAYMQLGFKLLNSLIDLLDDDLSVWFADLLNVSMEDYDKLPFGIEALVVQQILESDEVADFFSFASQAFKSTQKFRTPQKIGKTK